MALVEASTSLNKIFGLNKTVQFNLKEVNQILLNMLNSATEKILESSRILQVELFLRLLNQVVCKVR